MKNNIKYYSVRYNCDRDKVMAVVKRNLKKNNYDKYYRNNSSLIGMDNPFKSELNGFNGAFQPAIEISKYKYYKLLKQFKNEL